MTTRDLLSRALRRTDSAARHSSPSSDPAAACAEMAMLVSDTLGGLWLDREWDRDGVQALVARAAEVGGIPGDTLLLQVAVRILRDPELLEYPPAIALEAQLRRLVVFAPVDYVAVWGRDDGSHAERVRMVGERDAEAGAEAVVSRALRLSDEVTTGDGTARTLIAIPILRWQQPHAVLLARFTGERSLKQCRLLLNEAAGMLGPVIEREALLQRSTVKERALVRASERGMERLGLDLHDRPIQDLACLADDLRLFREQLQEVLGDHEHAAVLAGRMDDLDARLLAVHAELRQVSHGLVSPMLAHRTLPTLLEAEAEAFRSVTDVALEVDVAGELDNLSVSQRVALLRITQEALSNVREHGEARKVTVRVRGEATHVEAEITDDGRGFDVSQALADAARRGRLGLVGMTERARLLGGTCIITSAPGRTTSITVRLPRWEEQPPASSPVKPHPLAADAADH